MELVMRAQKGDERAWNTLVRKYMRKISGTVYRVYGSHPDSDDVIQEVLIALAKSLRNYRGDASFSTYLYRVTLNSVYRYIKRNKRASLITDAVEWDDERSEVLHERESNFDRLHAQDERHRVAAALKQLTPQKRSAVVLFEVENLTLKEIAALFKVPLQTIWSRVTSGKKDLLRLYKHNGEKQ